jgi:8-oxo-dGTP diphosphatase
MFYVNVEGAVFREDKWLIIERSKREGHAGGLLSLPGGTVEKEGNSRDLLERTLKRELFEEIGIELKPEIAHINNTSFLLQVPRYLISYFCVKLVKGNLFQKQWMKWKKSIG